MATVWHSFNSLMPNVSDVNKALNYPVHNPNLEKGLWLVRIYEQRWLLVSADVRGEGRSDEALRASAWETTFNWESKATELLYSYIVIHVNVQIGNYMQYSQTQLIRTLRGLPIKRLYVKRGLTVLLMMMMMITLFTSQTSSLAQVLRGHWGAIESVRSNGVSV